MKRTGGGSWLNEKRAVRERGDRPVLSSIHFIPIKVLHSDMIFGCDYLISYVSQYFPLYPGDIILTGTPEGVILGSRGRRKWISPGDTVEVEIERLGTLRNTFVDEVEASALPAPL